MNSNNGILSIIHTASPCTIITMLRYGDAEVRAKIAYHPKTPRDILDLLGKDRDALVRRNVAENWNSSNAILSQLVNDKDEFVREACILNPNTTSESLEILSRDRVPLIAREAKKEMDCREKDAAFHFAA